MTENVLPKFIEGERSVLGAMLLSSYAQVRACQVLSSDDFYSEPNRITFRAMRDLQRSGEVVDWSTLTHALAKSGNLERVGGVEYLTGLSDSCASAANVDHYIKYVREKGLLRRTIQLCRESIDCASRPDAEVSKIIEAHFKGMTELESTAGDDDHLVPLVEAITPVFEDTMNAVETGRKPGIPSGFVDLDRFTGGLQRQDYTVICGRPSMGKSAFGFQVADFISRSHPVAVFSVEMGRASFAQRYLSREAKINLLKVRNGELDRHEIARLVEVMGEAEGKRLYVDFTPAISPSHIRLKVRELEIRAGVKLGLIMADYLQLMHGIGNHKNREQEVSEISRECKAIAKEFNVPFVALAQLNREVEKRNNKRPLLSDLRESGAIEQDVDLLLAIHREHRYNESAHPNEAELIIMKQRNGPVGTMSLFWSPETSSFQNWGG